MEHHFLKLCLGYVWAMFGPILANNYFQTSQSSKMLKTESPLSRAYFYGVSTCVGYVWTLFGLYLVQVYFQTSQSSGIFKTEGHVWTMIIIALQPNQQELQNIKFLVNMIQGLCLWGSAFLDMLGWPMLGPSFAWLHFQTSQSSEVFQIESNGLRPMSMEQKLFWTVSGLCWDHV